jgi:hypothetical protein
MMVVVVVGGGGTGDGLMFWRNEKSPLPAGIQTQVRPACSLLTSPTKLHRPFPPEPCKCRTIVELTRSTGMLISP